MVNDRLTGLWTLYLKRLRSDVEIEQDPFTLCIPFHFSLECLLAFEGKQWGFPGQDFHDVVLGQTLPEYLLRQPHAGIAWHFVPGAFIDDRFSCNWTKGFRDSIRVSPASGLKDSYLLLKELYQVLQKLLEPVLWDPVDALKSAGELTIDRAGGLSIVAQVHGTQRSFTERIGVVKRPERGLKRAHHKPLPVIAGGSFCLNEPLQSRRLRAREHDAANNPSLEPETGERSNIMQGSALEVDEIGE